MEVTLLDYGAGNVRSVRNAIKKLGYSVKDVTCPADIEQAQKLIFPGVGNFGRAMDRLNELGYTEPLLNHLRENKPFLGICLGLQTLFEESEENPGVAGLGIINGQVKRFAETANAVPHIGWNGIRIASQSSLLNGYNMEKLYFVHSYRALVTEANSDWVLTTTHYDGEFISGVQKGNITAFQFHPEKSGEAGLNIFRNFLNQGSKSSANAPPPRQSPEQEKPNWQKESSPALT